LLAITLIVSACSLLYELLIAQTLSLLAGNTVVWYSLTVGTYLGAMGLGAVVFRPRTQEGAWARLFKVELLLSLLGAAAVLLIQLAHSIHLFLSPANDGGSLFVFFGVSLTMTLLVGLLSGVELPLLIGIGNDIHAGGRLTNRVLGWDYIGALVAGVLFPLALVPFISLPVIGFSVALANLSVAAYVLRHFVPRDTWMLEKSVATAALAGLLLVGTSQGDALQQYFLKRYYFHFEAAERAMPFSALGDLPNVTRAYSPYQKIDLVYDPSGYPTDTAHRLSSREPARSFASRPPVNRSWPVFSTVTLGSSTSWLMERRTRLQTLCSSRTSWRSASRRSLPRRTRPVGPAGRWTTTRRSTCRCEISERNNNEYDSDTPGA
jgi:spermidine synthase